MSVLDRHVVISGGGTGIGACMAELFSKAGARVSILGRRAQPLQETASQFDALAVTCDVTDRDAVESALNEARSSNGPVSIAIANAGAAQSAPFARMSAADLEASLSVNLIGVFNLWQATLADMRAQSWGRMIAVASIAGLRGYAYVSGYCAAKHGVVGLTRAVAQELATSGITVNALCPSFVETPLLDQSVANVRDKTGMSCDAALAALREMNPQKRFVTAAEVAAAAMWLCSEQARPINGHAMALAGGEA